MYINEYIIKTGKEDEERLDALGKVYEKSTEEFLVSSGLKEGMHAADFGCGIGNTTRLISEVVGKKGKVIGIDNSEKQIELADSRFKKNNSFNVNFEKLDIYDLSKITEKFDFVYCRLVFINLKKPELALKEMLSTLKPGGIIAVEEFINPTETFCYPELKSFDDHVNFMKTIHKAHNFDPEIGKKMKHLFLTNNITIEKMKIVQPILGSETERSLPFLNVLAQETDMEIGYDKEKMRNDLKLLIKDDSYLITYYKIIQIIGRKK